MVLAFATSAVELAPLKSLTCWAASVFLWLPGRLANIVETRHSVMNQFSGQTSDA